MANTKTVAIIGGGPAGLMAAEVLIKSGIKVDVYDAMPSVGRKFLMAGKGGMNISNAEPFDRFLTRYGASRRHLEAMLSDFGPDALVAWLKELGINTFTGSSGRIFPTDMKAAPLLRAWLHRLRLAGVMFHVRHQWLGWTENNALRFNTANGEKTSAADATILALGGASWPQLGSTGTWVPLLHDKSVTINPLKPANCGFDVSWSEYFCNRFAGQALKSVQVSFIAAGQQVSQKGEFVITQTGLEGGLIYSLSALLRDEIAVVGSVTVYIDLAPDNDFDTLLGKVSMPRGKQSLANHLRKRLKLSAVKIALLHEILSTDDCADPMLLCTTIKALPVKLTGARPIGEAISSAGGICFSAIDDKLMLSAMPGVFCAGEMLDWEAPTGGYLLTACFATGLWAGLGVRDWLNAPQERPR
ncbi:MAG: TIGR03862 family flavoprotein [Methylococcaceae bacterium]|nr:TIGR03862 family flavoprotein [Methylococcaceae bacterium]MDZ4156743.1 TIGR03862 family flavoprotein [Methylococcales bacterium]MDP2393353.1 TIGR03862 family flavoprotein [Methylococcaceae bacterium]MDP3018326.1 TIGR03862 family flavoprotein [Methylococcaceae bacterium]MDP3388544.1 TIGR03862 family flavoprotein [Methylococcaceae bacterium]